mmetsp:Transcript_11979/g.34331  ORF Transcript_11979/g.34331 Transcript_11979/m.34331 type:complete len:96 (-) Transcript_11979:1052-1339(-)
MLNEVHLFIFIRSHKEMIQKVQMELELCVDASIFLQSISHRSLASLRVLFLDQIVRCGRLERRGEHLHVWVELRAYYQRHCSLDLYLSAQLQQTN